MKHIKLFCLLSIITVSFLTSSVVFAGNNVTGQNNVSSQPPKLIPAATQYAYVVAKSSDAHNFFTIINLATNKVVKKIPLPFSFANSIAITPDQYAYAISGDPRVVNVIDLALKKIVQKITFGPSSYPALTSAVTATIRFPSCL